MPFSRLLQSKVKPRNKISYLIMNTAEIKNYDFELWDDNYFWLIINLRKALEISKINDYENYPKKSSRFIFH